MQASRTVPLDGKLDDRKNVYKEPIRFEDLPEELQHYLSDRSRRKKDERNTAQILEGKHVLTLILYIDAMSPVLKSDIYNNVSRSGGMVEKIEDLVELGLVKVYCTARTNSQILVITEKGKLVAGLIREIVGTVEGKR
ncbi:MAG: hypothetical protein E7Z70_07295 [Thermoplasmata archaeon]|nr:hypothetical protein [Thermoplasmata archaeon]